jgi:hypothetical protein
MTISSYRGATSLLLSGLCGLMLTGCTFTSAGGNINPAASQADANSPIIQALSANPIAITKSQVLTVTIKAYDPKQQALDYTWSATGGTLSSTTGQLVQWTPPTTAGAYTISVLVTNGTGGSSAGSLNLTVDEAGNGTVTPGAAKPATQPSAAAKPSTQPTAASTIAGKVLHEDGFEGGMENWVAVDRDKLKWATAVGGAFAGNAAAAFSEGATVKPGTAGSGSLNFKKHLDLSATKLPRVRFAVKNTAAPASAVTFQATWIPELPQPGIVEQWSTHTAIGTGFSGGSEWTTKELDLSQFKNKPGYLRISASVDGKQSAAFGGPMIDSVTIYDAGAQ